MSTGAASASVPSALLRFLRVAVATAAGMALVLHVLNVALLWWLWAQGAAEPLGVDVRRIVPVTIRLLAWGFGFSLLALAIVWRAGHRYEVLVAGGCAAPSSPRSRPCWIRDSSGRSPWRSRAGSGCSRGIRVSMAPMSSCGC